jgi:nucleotide-binding universal stress UspA family protein
MTYTLSLPRIVVGVDGSAASAAAVRWAVREARLRHATVHLVCAYHGDARLRAPYASSSWTVHLHQRRAAARTVLDLATEAASRRLPPERLISELADEPPARALLDRAAGAEMLVLGTTRPERQPGQPSLAMGPVARTCLRLAHCPVVVVAPDAPPAGQGAGRRRRTLARSGERPSALPPRVPVPLG